MTPAQYLARRNVYSYPAVGLDGTLQQYAERRFPSLMAMEDFNRALLRSQNDADSVLGYLSVVYWGHYTGQNQVVRSQRALGKVRLALDGKYRKRKGKLERMRGVVDLGASAVAKVIRQAATSVDNGQYGEALTTLSKLPQLNFAFSSKVCAFLAPEKCGVIDSVIAKKHTRLGFEVDASGYVRNKLTNAAKYTSYCALLKKEADALNASGAQFMWRDRNGTACRWRAVDVERALY